MSQVPDRPDSAGLLTSLLTSLIQVGYRDHDALDAFMQRAAMMLRRIFGEESTYLSRLDRIQFTPAVYPTDDRFEEAQWNSGLAETRNLISAAIEEIQLFAVPTPETDPLAAGPNTLSGLNDSNTGVDANEESDEVRPTVFIVHGHNDAVKSSVARYLEKLRLDIVILHERASRGQTIIEKFEAEAERVQFAVVLLTDDDVGGAVNGPVNPRARQNVVLELGYFLGRLGRRKVAALVSQGVELPGDYSGVVYVGLGDESWKLELAKEMKAAGLPIDMNDAL